MSKWDQKPSFPSHIRYALADEMENLPMFPSTRLKDRFPYVLNGMKAGYPHEPMDPILLWVVLGT